MIQFQINMTNKISRLGLLLALAFILSYLESLIPITLAIPGIKLGLANIVLVYILIKYGFSEAILIATVRNLLVAVTFGNFSLFIYTMAGSFLSIIFMTLLKNIKFNKKQVFGITGISLIGGVMHNVGQIIVAILTISNINLLYYLPILVLAGAITGFIIGLIVEQVIKYKY